MGIPLKKDLAEGGRTSARSFFKPGRINGEVARLLDKRAVKRTPIGVSPRVPKGVTPFFLWRLPSALLITEIFSVISSNILLLALLAEIFSVIPSRTPDTTLWR
jgi:hypothetical protein